jgi:hypothetical protein
MYWWEKMNLEGTYLYIYTSYHNFSSFNVDYQMDIVYTEQPSAPTNKQTAGRVDEAIFSMILKRSVSRPTRASKNSLRKTKIHHCVLLQPPPSWYQFHSGLLKIFQQSKMKRVDFRLEAHAWVLVIWNRNCANHYTFSISR